MKALTLWQPWASLVAIGVKTIETRSWSTTYRGPLAIHAARRDPDSAAAQRDPGTVTVLDLYPAGYPLPLGRVVARCTLIDVVQVVEYDAQISGAPCMTVRDDPMLEGLTLVNYCTGRVMRIEKQRPFGDFTPGRFAWLLGDIRQVADPVPARGRQGLWEWKAA